VPDQRSWTGASKRDTTYTIGLAGTKPLHRRTAPLAHSTLDRYAALKAANPTLSAETKIRRFTDFYDGAESWSWV
jgi:hypothetical protein